MARAAPVKVATECAQVSSGSSATPLAGNPGSVTASGGSVWVADPVAERVYQGDPDSGSAVDRIPVGAEPGSIVSGGGAKPPFGYYRSHKVQLSLVERLSRHWLVQIGGFVSPAGQNALDEKGISVVLWTQR